MAHEHSCDRIADEFTSRMLECRREPTRVNVAELGSRHLCVSARVQSARPAR